MVTLHLDENAVKQTQKAASECIALLRVHNKPRAMIGLFPSGDIGAFANSLAIRERSCIHLATISRNRKGFELKFETDMARGELGLILLKAVDES